MDIEVVNPNSKTRYFSYQRTTRAALSLNPVLARVVPLFPRRFILSGTIDLSGVFAGVALQNLESTDTMVRANLLDDRGARIATATLAVPAGRYVVKEVSEIFRTWQSGSSVEISSTNTIQAMGVSVDTAGRVRPLAPR